VTIHETHPFADPDPDPARRLRGRLGGTVTLWTAGSGAGRAGLTLTSVLVVLGEPARLLGLVDPDSDLADAVGETGRAVVHLLAWADRDLAEGFAGTAPAPGGVFRQATFADTEWGPRLEHAGTWAGVRVEAATELGWSRLLTCVVEHLEIGEETDPLLHRRGRFGRLGSDG
jgi:flavin reductase (DIM6/NTAB) family NADH-FMN oxidoreductase RutF